MSRPSAPRRSRLQLASNTAASLTSKGRNLKLLHLDSLKREEQNLNVVEENENKMNDKENEYARASPVYSTVKDRKEYPYGHQYSAPSHHHVHHQDQDSTQSQQQQHASEGALRSTCIGIQSNNSKSQIASVSTRKGSPIDAGRFTMNDRRPDSKVG